MMRAGTPTFWLVTLGLLLLGGYTLTAPVNHSEANDAYGYAYSVETATPSQLWHSQHLLYLPTARGLWGLARHAGLADRAFPVMVWFSRLCGVLSVLVLFLLLQRRLAARDPTKFRVLCLAALAGAGGLAWSYGFWRYSNEAEIYTPAALLILLAWLAAAGRPRLRNVLLSGALAALACLMHLLNVLPALAAIPVFYLAQRRFRAAIAHGLLAGGLTGVTYLAFYGSRVLTEIFGTSADQPEGGLALTSAVKGLVALMQTLTAGNFLFAYEKFQHALVQLFPYRALARQIFTGQHADLLVRTVPFITLALLLVLGLALLILRRKTGRTAGDAPLAGAAATWLGLQTIVLLLTEPGSPENWVMALPPLWLLLTVTLYAPLAAAGRPLLPLAIAVLLGVHNYGGGLRLLADPRGDFTACKSAWLLQYAKPGDLILTADSFEYMRYLRYHSSAEVVHLISDAPPANLSQRSGRVFATAEVFDLPAALQRRFPRRAVFLEKLGRELAPGFARIVTNEFGGVFERNPR
jgi:ABC-type methionine transport system permease subunit